MDMIYGPATKTSMSNHELHNKYYLLTDYIRFNQQYSVLLTSGADPDQTTTTRRLIRAHSDHSIITTTVRDM